MKSKSTIRCGAKTAKPVKGKIRRCGRKANHKGDHQSPIGNGDTTFWFEPYTTIKVETLE